MAKNIQTVGQLREFLVNTMLGVKDGSIKIDEASRITKLAAQVNESFYSEIKIAKTMLEAGQEAIALGKLPINSQVE